MSLQGVARNYAEALLVLAEKAGDLDGWAAKIDAVAEGVRLTPQAEAVLMSPRITKEAKAKLVAAALPGAPKEFVGFVQAVVKRGRQGLLRAIADEYLLLADAKLDRVRARIILARDATNEQQMNIVKWLSDAIGKSAIADFETDPSLLGGAVVRIRERLFDGSIKRKMSTLRRVLVSK